MLWNYITTFWLKEPRQIVKQNPNRWSGKRSKPGKREIWEKRPTKTPTRKSSWIIRTESCGTFFSWKSKKKFVQKLCKLHPFRLTCWTTVNKYCHWKIFGELMKTSAREWEPSEVSEIRISFPHSIRNRVNLRVFNFVIHFVNNIYHLIEWKLAFHTHLIFIGGNKWQLLLFPLIETSIHDENGMHIS